jgi:hypothetical protein
MQNSQDLFSIPQDFSEGGIVQLTIILAAAFLCGLATSGIVRTYYREGEPVDVSISRSFPLMAPAVAMVFWLIQFSLPLSLGLLGALSFVRFRTPVKRAEDIAFILLVIASSLACAVGSFGSAALLLVIVALFGLVRRGWKRRGAAGPATLVIHFNDSADPAEWESRLRDTASGVAMVSLTRHDGRTSVVYHVPRLADSSRSKLLAQIEERSPDARVELYFPEAQPAMA